MWLSDSATVRNIARTDLYFFFLFDQKRYIFIFPVIYREKKERKERKEGRDSGEVNLLIPDIFGHYKKERILTNSMYPKNTDYRRNTIHTYIHELYTQGGGGGGD